MKYAIAIVSSVILLPTLTRECRSADERQAAAHRLLGELEDVIFTRRGSFDRAWALSALARDSAANKDYPIAARALRAIDDHGHRLTAARGVCRAIAEASTDDEVLTSARDMSTWRLWAANAGRQTLEHDQLSVLIYELRHMGRCKLARRLEKEFQLPQSVESLLLNGQIDKGVMLFTQQRGRDDIEEASLVAVRLCRAGETGNAILFLEAGWPERKADWSRELCLELAHDGQDVVEVVERIGDVPRRSALLRACRQLKEWPQTYAGSLRSNDIGRRLSTLSHADVVSTARLLAACAAQHDKSEFDSLCRIAHSQLSQHRAPLGIDRLRESMLRCCLLKELIICRLDFSQFESIQADLDAAKKGMSEAMVLTSLSDVIVRLTSQGVLSDISNLQASQDRVAERTAISLGFVGGVSGRREELPNLEGTLKSRLRMSVWGRLMDDLYE